MINNSGIRALFDHYKDHSYGNNLVNGKIIKGELYLPSHC